VTENSECSRDLEPDLENVDELTSRAFQAFRKTVHLQRQLALKAVGQKGVHIGEAFCLRLLAVKDGLSQRDLADVLHLSRPRVTGMLQALEKAGAVKRRSDEHDRRLTRVFITQVGRHREMELRSIVGIYINETFGALSATDTRELERLLGLLADQVSEMLQKEEATSQ